MTGQKDQADVMQSGVPGEVRGLAHLHDNYGVLNWETVLFPAIQVARKGFSVTADLVRYMASATVGIDDFLTNNPTWALDFAPNGTRLGLGDTITRKRYADTLETIAQKGPDAFYTGAIARNTIKALQAANGTMNMMDLANYTVAIRPPSTISYRGWNLTSCSAPSSGEVALSALNILSGYENFFGAGTTNLSTHRLDEAIRFAYGEVRQIARVEQSKIINTNTEIQPRRSIFRRKHFSISSANAKRHDWG
ncbi:MAG: hypothetical protein M1812_000614 [Candelaria pacifica]|nr:MAG: hypothetical protein M1812_000614 [Candelaria pacifica]